MNGVQILNQWEVVVDTQFSWGSFWVGAALGFGLVAFITATCLAGDWDWKCFFGISGILGLIVAILLGLLGGYIIAPTPIEWETRYEVSIGPEVSMSEFMDKYEILETRGSIYTIRENDQQGD